MAKETGKDGKPILQLASPEEWEAWLEAEHAASDGVWLKFAKKGSGVTTVVYAEALDVALCFGWIDSQAMTLDERFYLQKFTPRRSRSNWSKINGEKIEALHAGGPDEAGGPRGGRAREGRRALGRGVRVASEQPRCRPT